MKKVIFIINPIYGINRNPDRVIQWIDESWKDAGISYDIIRTDHRGHGIEIARAAADAGVDMVVAAGGDGTINEVGQGLIGSDTALGVIPAGSGNGFARNVSIPLNQRRAIEGLKNPRFHKFDVGKINDYYFFNVAGAGIDANISHRFDNSTIRGPVPYFIVGVQEYFRFKPDQVIIELADREIERNPVLLSFANLPEFGINATIAPNAKPDDGLLDICILSPVKLRKALVNLPKLFNGRIDQLSEMEIYQVRKVVIHRFSGGPIHTDGDPHDAASTLTVEVLPQAVRIALPSEEFSAPRRKRRRDRAAAV